MTTSHKVVIATVAVILVFIAVANMLPAQAQGNKFTTITIEGQTYFKFIDGSIICYVSPSQDISCLQPF